MMGTRSVHTSWTQLQNATSDLEYQVSNRLIWVSRPFSLEEFSEIDQRLESLLMSWLDLLRQARDSDASDGGLPLI